MFSTFALSSRYLATASFTYKVEFAWGSAFNGMNPAEFYDDSDATNAEINQVLTAMHNLLDGLTVSVDIIAHVN